VQYAFRLTLLSIYSLLELSVVFPKGSQGLKILYFDAESCYTL
jgi:hypothetical protein